MRKTKSDARKSREEINKQIDEKTEVEYGFKIYCYIIGDTWYIKIGDGEYQGSVLYHGNVLYNVLCDAIRKTDLSLEKVMRFCDDIEVVKNEKDEVKNKEDDIKNREKLLNDRKDVLIDWENRLNNREKKLNDKEYKLENKENKLEGWKNELNGWKNELKNWEDELNARGYRLENNVMELEEEK